MARVFTIGMRFGKLAKGRDEPPAKFTRREREIAEVLGEDLPPKQLAARLKIGRETVRTHLRSIYRKLGVRSRHAAVAVWMRIQQNLPPQGD